MGSDDDGVVGKIKAKAKAFMGEETRGDADPDIEYEPHPEQEVLHDGMVVLNKEPETEAGTGGEDSTDSGTGNAEAESGSGSAGSGSAEPESAESGSGGDSA